MSEAGLTGRLPITDGFDDLTNSAWPRRWWANGLCFIFTLVTTTVFGSALYQSFRMGRPLEPDLIWASYVHFTHGDAIILNGLQFSVPLLLILLAHEFGHYFQCRHWRVDATLPYFLPSPTLFGTLGAFIRIKSPIFTRRGLFDIAVSGPLAGFMVLIPFLIVGTYLSRQVHPALPNAPFVFGTPLAFRIVESLFFPGVTDRQILLHPTAMAAWAGLLATAMNLLPMGQLDGGHLLYACFGQRPHRMVSTALVAVLGVLGFWYWPWWVWSAILFFFGRRHPLVYDQSSLPPNRWILLVLSALMFLLSASIIPVWTT